MARLPRRGDHRPMINTASTAHAPLTLASAKVADAMTIGVINCTPETPLSEVARLMAKYRVHAVFVYDYRDEDGEDLELWGLVSDLDVVAGAWAGIEERTAGDSAVAPLVTVRSDDPLEHAAQLMAEHGVSHLAVMDEGSGRPVGVLSSLDIAQLIADVPRDGRGWRPHTLARARPPLRTAAPEDVGARTAPVERAVGDERAGAARRSAPRTRCRRRAPCGADSGGDPLEPVAAPGRDRPWC